MQNAPRYKRAVVVGASMTGLAAARAVSPHFEQVVVVEKDTVASDRPAHRRGVPQSFHIHNLILRGQYELERLFPSYRERALSLGAVELNHASQVARRTELGWQPLFESEFVGLSATRILLEFAQRSLFFEQVKNAAVLEQTRVTAPIVERGEAVRIAGVYTDHADPEWQLISADLVIDCSGRAALWKRWFDEAGLPPVDETVVDSKSGYSSRFYRAHDVSAFPWRGMVVDSTFPHVPRWGVISPLEGDEWVVTLGGIGGDFPPSDEQGFDEFARSLDAPEIVDALERAQPISPVRTFRRMEMRWNHFEHYRGKVRGFLAMGDSAWAYNPLYGQGMTVGAVCAGALLNELDANDDLETLAARYYPRAARFARGPWHATALRDLRWPNAVGDRPWHLALSGPLSEFALKAAHYDTRMFASVLEIVHLVKQPHQAFGLNVLWGIARYAMQRLFRVALPRHDTLQLPGEATETAHGEPTRPANLTS